MFRIGEFSKLARVSIRTLRHYDEIGLLVPDQVGPENGYQYYSAQQLSQIARIQLLREMGIGLQTIGQMLQQLQNPHELERFLALQQLQLKDQQQELQHRIALVAVGDRPAKKGAEYVFVSCGKENLSRHAGGSPAQGDPLL